MIEFREDFLNKNDRQGLYDLYRGNPIILQYEVTEENITTALMKTYTFWRNAVMDTQGNAYNYNHSIKKWENGTSNESRLRTLASIWVFVKLAKFFNDDQSLERVKEFVAHLVNKITHNGDLAFLEEDNIQDIGKNACVILILEELEVFPEYIPILTKFVTNAYFASEKRFFPIVKPLIKLPHESEFFLPGIALTALSQIKKNDKFSIANDIAENVFPYYRKLFKSSEEGIKMSLWMSLAYAEFYFTSKKYEYAEFVFEINDLLLEQQSTIEVLQVDLLGTFSRIGNAAVTAAAESLIAAYRVVKSCHLNERVNKYEKHILMALRFLLQSQYRSDNTFSEEIVGGYKNNFFDKNIRIDNLQHVSHAFLMYLNNFKVKKMLRTDK